MPQAFILVNPAAGKGNARRAAAYLQQHLPASWHLTIRESQYKGHLAEMAAAVPNWSLYDYLIVLGGDGSMNEVVNGLAERPEGVPPICLFPCGTGNSFNHDIGCYTWEQGLQNLLRGQIRPTDIYQITTSSKVIYGFNVAGWGLISHINITAEQMRKIGKSRYSIAAVWHLLKNPNFDVKLTFNEQTLHEKISFVLFCNNQHTGAAMKIAPMADFSDGLLDLLIIRKEPFWKLLPLFPKIFKGTHVHSPIADFRRTTKISLEAEQLVLVVDGELVGASPFTLELLPRVFQMIV